MAGKKTRISRKVLIDAPKKDVWKFVSDFGGIYKGNPVVAKSYLTSDQKTGVGTTRHCDMTMMGASVEEKIIGWVDGESIKIDIFERKNMPMVNNMIADFSVHEEGKQTLLKATMEYDMTGGMGDMMNAVMMKKMNIKVWEKLLAGFKKHIETSELIEKSTPLEVELVEEFA
ncbi:MAG: SRPBCC family protein [Leptospirales bacterium]